MKKSNSSRNVFLVKFHKMDMPKFSEKRLKLNLAKVKASCIPPQLI